jgi:hypothetical protein
MLSRCSIGAVLALALAAVPAPAQQVQLEWKFKSGDKFYLETVNSFKQSMKTLGREVRQDLDLTFLFSVTVDKVNPDDKSAVLVQKVESIEAKNTGSPTGGIPAEDKFNQKVKGATFRVTVTPRGEVTKFEGYDDLVKQLAGDDPATRKTVQAVLSEDYLRHAAADVFGPLPGPVEPNATWGADKKVEVPLGPLGTFTTSRTYTFDGKATVDGKSVAKITFKGTASYSPPKSGEGGPFPFQVTKGDLKIDELHGTILFDDAAGRLVQSDATMHVKGTLTAVVSGNTLESELQQDRTIKTRLLDKPPTP